MYDFLLSPEEQELKKEVRQFVREEITSDFLRQMDKDDITYPREFVEKLAARGLRGIRFPKKYGGREMSWVAEVAAEEAEEAASVAEDAALLAWWRAE